MSAEIAETCPCGSGIAYGQCCGQISQAVDDQRESEQELFLLYRDAQQAFRDNRRHHCNAACQELLRRAPWHLGGLRLFSMFLRTQGTADPELLGPIPQRLLDGYPENPDATCDAGDAFEMLGQLDKAETCYAKLINDPQRKFRAHFGLARIAQRRHQPDLAEYHFRQAHYLNPQAPAVLNGLASVLSAVGRKPESEHYFRIAAAQAPDDAGILLSWARMEESRNNMDEAWRLFELARTRQPENPMLGINEAVLLRRSNRPKQGVTRLDTIDIDKLDPHTRAAYWYERAAVLDQMQLYDQAMRCAHEANALKRETGFRYEPDKQATMARALKSVFSKRNLKRLPPAHRDRDDDPRPVFILGFTRSGTSMVEQILSAHPRISGGDELPFIYDLVHNAKNNLGATSDYPGCLLELGDTGSEKIQELRRRYLARLRMTPVLSPGVPWFTDKMPMNELHLGLIHLIFPDARLVHVVRHPLDAVLSSYFTDATHGGFCTYELKSAAQHYTMLAHMVEHYREKLGLDYLLVRYEDVVADVRGQTKRMLEYIGEPFDPACIEFHANPRYARTASYAQVVKPLYKTSVYRYRNYRKHLEDIVPILEPVLRAYGYGLQ